MHGRIRETKGGRAGAAGKFRQQKLKILGKHCYKAEKNPKKTKKPQNPKKLKKKKKLIVPAHKVVILSFSNSSGIIAAITKTICALKVFNCLL